MESKLNKYKIKQKYTAKLDTFIEELENNIKKEINGSKSDINR